MSVDETNELGQEALHWMLLSVASIFLCGSCVSVVSVVLCYMALQDAERAAWAESSRYLKWGKRVTIAGVLLSSLGGALALLLRSLA